MIFVKEEQVPERCFLMCTWKNQGSLVTMKRVAFGNAAEKGAGSRAVSDQSKTSARSKESIWSIKWLLLELIVEARLCC